MNKIMESLDVKDRKILYELDFNSRQSNSKIGKKVGLHKNVVNYRIKRMEKSGIISNYYTMIDTFKIGTLVDKDLSDFFRRSAAGLDFDICMAHDFLSVNLF